MQRADGMLNKVYLTEYAELVHDPVTIAFASRTSEGDGVSPFPSLRL